MGSGAKGGLDWGLQLALAEEEKEKKIWKKKCPSKPKSIPVAETLQKSQVMGSARAFLLAYTRRSNPFFPGNMDGAVRSNSTTELVSKAWQKASWAQERTPSWSCSPVPLCPVGFPNQSCPLIGLLVQKHRKRAPSQGKDVVNAPSSFRQHDDIAWAMISIGTSLEAPLLLTLFYVLSEEIAGENVMQG